LNETNAEGEKNMKKSTIFGLITLIAVLSLGSGCPRVEIVCETGDTQECFCPDGTTGNQSCRADGIGWGVCECIDDGEQWCDDTSDLCWQDPPYQKNRGLCWQVAIDYCEQLSFDGYDDWRLPDITELRSLVRNCPGIETGGDCPVEDGSGWDVWDEEAVNKDSCLECYTEVSESTVCFWDPTLKGTCNRLDEVGSVVETWSSSPFVGDENYSWYVHFGLGVVGRNHTTSFADVRCVRDKSSYDNMPVCAPNDTEQCTCADTTTGAKKCSSDGSGWSECLCVGEDDHFDDECPEEGNLDPTECTRVSVTLVAPDDFLDDPIQIIGWLYPPGQIGSGPPEGGWYPEYNDPTLNAGEQFEMEVYAANIAKTKCITGEYEVFVTVATDPENLQRAEWEGVSDEPVLVGFGDVDAGVIEIYSKQVEE
jgi:hypothetical protein